VVLAIMNTIKLHGVIKLNRAMCQSRKSVYFCEI